MNRLLSFGLSFGLLVAVGTTIADGEHPLPISLIELEADGQLADAAATEQLIRRLERSSPTHVFLLAHGWNNSREDAARSYRRLVDELGRLADERNLRGEGYRPEVIGITWPSLAWDETRARARSGPIEAAEVDEGDGDLMMTLIRALSNERSPSTYETDLFRLHELLQKSPSQVTLDDQQEAMTILRRYSTPTEDAEDRSIFDAPPPLQADRAARGETSQSSIRDTFRVFTFWQMKKRAGVVGQSGGRDLLHRIARTCPDAEVHLGGHSFGAKLWLSALREPGLPRPVQSVTLLQPAISAYAFADRVPELDQPGGYRSVLNRSCVRGPIVVTFSKNDVPLSWAYPWGSWLANQSGERERSASRWAALGAVGVEGVASSGRTTIRSVGSPYEFSAGLWSVEGTAAIAGHSEIYDPRVVWLIWSSVRAKGTAGPIVRSQRTAESEMSGSRSTAGPRVLGARVYSGRLLDPLFDTSEESSRAGRMEAPKTSSRSGANAVEATEPTSSPSPLPPIQLKVLYPSAPRAAADRGDLRITSEELSSRQAVIDASPAGLRRATASRGIEQVEVLRPPLFDGVRMVPFNRDARITHLVDELTDTFSDHIRGGESIVGAVFDGGSVRDTHREFRSRDGAASRVTIHSSVTRPVSRHATHVAGTLGARGIRPDAHGMAENISILSFDWIDDLGNLDAVAGDIAVSNHSYGPQSGWSWNPDYAAWFWWGDTTLSQAEDAGFGKYVMDNRGLDEVLHKQPHLLTFVAAGNDRNDGPESQPSSHYVIGVDPATGQLAWLSSSLVRNADGSDAGGLDTIAGLGLSKNAICIGAIHDIVNEGDPIRTTDFSAWGPSDDGRVKPDLVANGQDLLSTSSAADDSYVELPGTSMASPTAAGIAALLVEQFEGVHGRVPESIEIKAALIHSATDAGVRGPDPIYGWGSINAFAAGRVVAGLDGAFSSRGSIAAGETRTFRFTRGPGEREPIRATLVWLDPPGPINTLGLDDPTPALVNDLDLTLTSADGAVHYPYSLVRSTPLAPATAVSANRVDNVEVVEPISHDGLWEIQVSAHQVSSGSNQPFALIVSGLTAANDAPQGDGVSAMNPADRKDIPNEKPTSPPVSEQTPNEEVDSAGTNAHANAGASRKLALLIGIDEFGPFVPPLRGCVNDVHDMKHLLCETFGFLSQDVTILTNEEADRDSVVRAIRHLIEQADANTTIVVGISSHGCQLPDDEANEEPDRLDEAVVLAGSGPDGQGDLRDDEIFELSTALAQKTDNVTFIFDLCFSGDASKGAGIARGIDRVPRGQVDRSVEVDRELFDHRNYTMISGCQSYQRSYELVDPATGQDRGALTYFLAKNIRRLARDERLETISFRTVMDQVKVDVRHEYPQQHPHLEGTNIDLVILGSTPIAPPDYVMAVPMDERSVRMEQGKSTGITKGSIYDLYQPEAQDFNDPAAAVARIEVANAGPFQSDARVVGESGLPQSLVADSVTGRPLSLRAIERVHVYSTDRIRIRIGDVAPDQQLPDLLREAKATIESDENLAGQFEFVTEDPARLVLDLRSDGPDGQRFEITYASEPRASGRILLNGDWKKSLVADLENWGRFFRTFRLDRTGSMPGLRFDLVADVANPETAKPLDLSQPLEHGTVIRPRVRKPKGSTLHLYLVNLYRDPEEGPRVEQLLPPPDSNRTIVLDDLQTDWMPDLSWPVAAFPSAPSRESLMLLATERPIDTGTLLTRGHKSFDPQAPSLEKLLEQAGLNGKPVSVPTEPGEFAIIRLDYEVQQ